MTTSEWNIALNRENTELRMEIQRLKAELSRVSEEKDLEWRCEYCVGRASARISFANVTLRARVRDSGIARSAGT